MVMMGEDNPKRDGHLSREKSSTVKAHRTRTTTTGLNASSRGSHSLPNYWHRITRLNELLTERIALPGV